jgi:hypothetical protein
MASIAQKKNVCSQKDVDVAVGRYLMVSISIEETVPCLFDYQNMGPQLVVSTYFESTTVSSSATKTTPVRMYGLKVCLAARGSFRQSLSRDCIHLSR